MNDLLSFHKEQLAGERHNFIHLYHQSVKSIHTCHGEHWSLSDTISDLCAKLTEAVRRIDARLGTTRADEESGVDDNLARQWTEFKNG